MTSPAITVELIAEPTHLGAAHLDDFTVGFTVRNLGQITIDPELNLSELRVNDAVSHDWGMALMNSGHDRTWKALPPGASVGGKWQLARELFPHPGDYKLVLTVQGVSSAPVDVHVTP
jgi:hypothetical protein